MNISTIKKAIKTTGLGKYIAKYYHQYVITRHKKSYSQVGEDIILDYLLGGKKNGFYVDIGAYHPVHLSNTCLFYKRGWKGIQIEPDEKRSLLFKKKRPNSITLNLGIGDSVGTSKFYIFKEEALSTFSKEVADLVIKEGHTLVKILEIPMMRLSDVFEKYAKNVQIDFVSIDTEGYDLAVLKTNDWNIFRPTFFVIETAEYSSENLGKKLSSLYDSFMQEKGYEKVADTYLNTIYRDSRK